jgi:hypothetical protein
MALAVCEQRMKSGAGTTAAMAVSHRISPRLTGQPRANHGHTLREASKLAELNRPKPLVAEQQFGPDEIAAACEVVATGNKGKVVVEL